MPNFYSQFFIFVFPDNAQILVQLDSLTKKFTFSDLVNG